MLAPAARPPPASSSAWRRLRAPPPVPPPTWCFLTPAPGTNFSYPERRQRGLEGLLPPAFESLELQAERCVGAGSGCVVNCVCVCAGAGGSSLQGGCSICCINLPRPVLWPPSVHTQLQARRLLLLGLPLPAHHVRTRSLPPPSPAALAWPPPATPHRRRVMYQLRSPGVSNLQRYNILNQTLSTNQALYYKVLHCMHSWAAGRMPGALVLVLLGLRLLVLLNIVGAANFGSSSLV